MKKAEIRKKMAALQEAANAAQRDNAEAREKGRAAQKVIQEADEAIVEAQAAYDAARLEHNRLAQLIGSRDEIPGSIFAPITKPVEKRPAVKLISGREYR